MAGNPEITAKMLATEIGITERHIRTNITKLKKAGLITRVDPDKNGHWLVKSD
jgi:ATP-dependent DNA helicase RecG